MGTELTGVIAEHIDAVNALDTDRIVATFADDAYVNDAHREFVGTDAIRRWVEREMVGDKVTAVPTTVSSTGPSCPPARSSCRTTSASGTAGSSASSSSTTAPPTTEYQALRGRYARLCLISDCHGIGVQVRAGNERRLQGEDEQIDSGSAWWAPLPLGLGIEPEGCPSLGFATYCGHEWRGIGAAGEGPHRVPRGRRHLGA
jgi:hypothetical protein